MNNADQTVVVAALKQRLDAIDGSDSWRNWLKPKTNKAVALGVLFAAVAIPIALLAWLQPEWSTHVKQDRHQEVAEEVRSQLNPVAGDLGQLTTQVAALSATVSSLNGNVQLLLQNALKTTASLPQTQFDNSLQTVSSQLSVARQLQSQVEPAIVENLRMKLAGSDKQELTTLWKAKGELISFESFGTMTTKHSRDPASLPECIPNANLSKLTLDMQFTCKVVLDGKTFSDMRFRNVVLIYRGGQLNLHNVELDHCYLVFELQSVPQTEGRKYMDALLGQPKMTNVTVG